jgi:hypothetical protein
LKKRAKKTPNMVFKPYLVFLRGKVWKAGKKEGEKLGR